MQQYHLGGVLGGARHIVSFSPLFVGLVAAFFLRVGLFGLNSNLPLGYLPMLIALWTIANFFFEIVEHRARGEREWPTLSMETLSSARQQVGILFGLLALSVCGVYYLLALRGWNQAALLFAGIVVVVLPAAAALLAATRNLAKALNPYVLARVVLGMGVGYFPCLAAAIAAGWLVIHTYENPSFLAYFASIYALFLLGYLIGSVVYSRRSALGMHAPRAPEHREARDHAERVRRRKTALDRAYSFAARGNTSGAIADIEDYLADADDTLEARLWVFNEMARWEDGYAATVYGERLIELLESNGFIDEAAKVRVTCDYLESKNQPR